MTKIFKYNQSVCKKTDDFGKTLLSSIINRKHISNIIPNLFTVNSELYSDKIHEPFRCTYNELQSGSIISNEINDEMLSRGCRDQRQLNLNNIEINECGIGGHHQLKSTTSMLMLILKIAQYSDPDDNIIITMDIKFNKDNTIDIKHSKLKKWSIQNELSNGQEYITTLKDDDYQFESNISLNFISIDLPTHNSRVNTDILSNYYEYIVEYLNYVIESNRFYNQILNLDSDEIKLSRDSSNNYNKFGLIHNLYLSNINSKNFFYYIQQILDFNNIHFGQIYDGIEYNSELILTSFLYTVSQYGYTNLIKNYIQKDHYIRSYGVKFMNMLNGTFGSRSYNIVPDFLRFTLKTREKNEPKISFNKKHNYIKIDNKKIYYKKYTNGIYVAYDNIFDEFDDRIRLENILIYIIKLGLFQKDDLIKFIPYQRFNNKLLQNKIHISTSKLKSIDVNSKDINYQTYKTEKLTTENLLKTISKKIKIEIRGIQIFKKMIDHRIFLKLMSYNYHNAQKIIDFFNTI